MEIKEAYVSFETAKLLKEKGFDVETNAYYYLHMSKHMRSKKMHKSPLHYDTNWNTMENYYSAPTHQMACAWLREKGYHIEIYTTASGYRFIITKTPPYDTDLVNNDTDLVNSVKGKNDGGAWDTYNECMEDAIKYCLTELI